MLHPSGSDAASLPVGFRQAPLGGQRGLSARAGDRGRQRVVAPELRLGWGL